MNVAVVRSRVFDIEFRGFRSSTVQLQAAGWQLAVSEDPGLWTLMVELYHPGFGLVMGSEPLDKQIMLGHMVMDARGPIDFRRPVVPISWVRHEYTNCIAPRLPQPVPFDARPEFVEYDSLPWEDLTKFFRPIAVPEEKEIIVGPQTVDEALALVLKMQAGDQAALREKSRDKARRVHAQIVSLAA